MELGTTPRDNDLLIILVIGLMGISIYSFTRHIAIGSTAQKALDKLFSNCPIPVSLKGSNITHNLYLIF